MKFGHTNLIARDWRKLVEFYQQVFRCTPLPPERDMKGDWLDQATAVKGAHIRGIHMRLPGYGDDGPTLEIFSYMGGAAGDAQSPGQSNQLGFSHIAFAVDDVAAVTKKVIEHGGSEVGAYTERKVEGVGWLSFQYMADPEGNIVEIQNWRRE